MTPERLLHPSAQLRYGGNARDTDLLQTHSSTEHAATSVFILFDEEMQELGAIVERPDQVTKEMADETRRFQKEPPELSGIRRAFDRMPEETRVTVKQHIAEWREDQQDRWARYLFEDLADIMSKPRQSSAA